MCCLGDSMNKENIQKEWEQIVSLENLRKIHDEHTIKSNASGVDNITGKEYSKRIEEEIKFINKKLVCQQYRFSKYKISYILKGVQEPRIICIPTQRDKIVAYAIVLLLNNLFEKVAKTPLPQTLIAEISERIQSFSCGIKLDLHDFYGSIDHDILFYKLQDKIKDEYILNLIRQAIDIDRRVSSSGENQGVPQGLSFSNALANIYLTEIDQKYRAIKDACYVRYVDDIILLSNNQEYFDCLKSDLKEIKLKLNEEKEHRIQTKINSFYFIGYEFKDGIVSIRDEGIKKVINSLDRIIRKNRSNINAMFFKLNIRITGLIWGNKKYGWMFYYSQTQDLSQLFFMDRVLRTKLFPRYGIKEDTIYKIKRFVRVYWEIRKSLHNSNYILNVDKVSAKEKSETIKTILRDNKEHTQKEIDELYFQVITREITDMEKDVQNIS